MKQLEKIYIVFKTHVDLGFTDLASHVVTQYKEQMMDEVASVCEETKADGPDHHYVWTLPAWMLSVCLDTKDAKRKARIEALIRNGQLRWHGLPFTTHTEFCGTEEYIRGLYYSENLRQQYGHTAISAKMTDVPGHTWMLPTLLKQAGIEFLHLGVNACSAPVDVPRLFQWEGPDGSRVLTYYSKGAYGTDLTPPDDWPYPIWLALLQTSDNDGPHDGHAVRGLLAEIAKKYPDTVVKIGTMDDFAQDFIRRDFQDIPVVRKDLADTWIHGIGTYPEEVARVRRLRPAIAKLESLSTLAAVQGLGDKCDAAVIADAYEHTLLFGEHTWGIDIKSNLLPGRNSMRAFGKEAMAKDRERFPDSYAKTEASWLEQKAYVDRAEEALSRLRPLTAEGSAIVGVYNPSAWERRTAKVSLDVYGSGTLIDRETQETYRVNRDGEVCLDRIGPMRYRTFVFEANSEAEKAGEMAGIASGHAVLENQTIRIEVSQATGAIVSFYDKRNQKEWAAGGSFGRYEYEVYGKVEILDFVKAYSYDLTDWYVNDFGKPGYPRIDHQSYAVQLKKVSISNGEGWGAIEIHFTTPEESWERFGNGEEVRLSIRLDEGQPFADLGVHVLRKASTAYAESGHFTFALNAAHPSYRFQKLGSVVNPLADIEKGANTRLHCASHWVDVQDGPVGLAIMPMDTPLFSIGEKGIYQYSKTYTPQQPDLHFNLFNNQWGTNFPQWLGGSFHYAFRLAPHAGDWKQGRVQQAALEAFTPLQATAAWDPDSPSSYSFLKESVEGVQILAFKKAERDDAYVLRLQNLHDVRSTVTLSFTKTIASAVVCDLVERDVQAVAGFSGGDTLTVAMQPFGIVTLKLFLAALP
ncbi:DUF5054 domain-containing protein [Paenibacillus whitsoniae]|uniref:DUF5054 domain-containing protein n=1 Tax=Paenibacillus whitsoniae TaxID=2496558 RepID=A0A430JI41_9BACL|nr:DUF5054 domain-containing protein [Paenibacillus whitsoniae]RTE10646.1 DUF5054 domain-containing protein [Paenibacillus whitsoniae]